MSSWMRSLSSSVLSTSTRKTMELGNVIARLEALVNHLVTTKVTVRLSRNRNSEYLPQRRKGCKVRRLRVKIIYKRFCPFPVTLAPLRLGGRNSRLRVLSMARLFAQAAQIFNYSNTKASDILIMNFVPIISFDAQQRPLLSRLLKKNSECFECLHERKIIIKSIPLRSS